MDPIPFDLVIYTIISILIIFIIYQIFQGKRLYSAVKECWDKICCKAKRTKHYEKIYNCAVNMIP